MQMVTVFVGYAVVLLATAILTAALASYAWDHRDALAARPLAVTLAGQTVWCGTTFAATVTRGTPWAFYWSRLVYVGVVLAVAGLFCFSLAFTRRTQYLTRRTYALLAVEPVLLLALVATNYRTLHYVTRAPSPESMIGFEFVWGPGFWLHVAYSYMLLGIGSVLLLAYAFSSDSVRQRQVYAILLAAAVPWLGTTVYLLGDLAIDTTPLAFSLTSIVLTWAVFRGGLLDIRPVAHQAVVDSLGSAVIVVDFDGVVVEANSAARALLEESELVGREMTDVFGADTELRAQYAAIADATTEQRTTVTASDRHFDVEVTPLYGSQSELVGRAFLVHEITDQKTREQELERRNKQLDRFASVVSTGLRDPLTVADSRLDVARTSGDPSQFDRIEAAYARMDRLIDDLLTLSREGDGESTETSLSALAATAWARVDTGGATLDVEADRPVVGDRALLESLFENAFRAAVERATDRIDITVGGTPDGFTVTDTGVGQVDADSSVRQSAVTTAGVELALVDHVATAHGWTMRPVDASDDAFQLEITGLSDAESTIRDSHRDRSAVSF